MCEYQSEKQLTLLLKGSYYTKIVGSNKDLMLVSQVEMNYRPDHRQMMHGSSCLNRFCQSHSCYYVCFL